MAAVRPAAPAHPDALQQKAKVEALLITIETLLKGSSKDLADKENWAVSPSVTPTQRALLSEENILRVSHKIKSEVDPLTTNKTASIHVDSHHGDLAIIKINQFRERNIHPDLKGMFLATLVYKNSVRDYYFVKRDKELTPALTNLIELASTLGIAEFSLTKGMIDACKDMTMPTSFWGRVDWEEKNTYGLYYEKVNDPLVLDQFIQHVLPLQAGLKPGEPLVILDMGAGKGRLADKLITKALEKDVPIHYIFVEPIAAQIEVARERFKKYAGNKNCNIKIIQSTLEALDLKAKAHCIISSGGTLNMNVVTRDAAIENIKKLSNLLCPKGFLIATGQTAILIKAKHFKLAGLNILSYATPCVLPEEHKADRFLEDSRTKGGFFNHFQRYVCQKTVDDAKAETAPTPRAFI